MYYATLLVKGSGLGDLRSTLENITGLTFREYDSLGAPAFESKTLHTRIRIYDAGYEDDQGLSLSQYEYAVDFEVEADLLDEAEQKKWLDALALLVGRTVTRRLACECIVVGKLQQLIYGGEHMSS